VAEHLATDEISIGDFVLSGGELAAAMILDAVTRLIPGALGNEDSIVNESFSESAVDIARVKTGAPGQLPDFAAHTSHESRVTNHGISPRRKHGFAF
jgi:tRNA (guanine37-N1)-methyltransferase